ncbi:MAG: right-handed parallel beta-helix repeat-containing protein, partial [Actinomycetota bacterium]
VEQAVRAAQSGDTIQLGPGVYHESVQVFGEALTIVGAGAGRTILDGARVVSGFEQEFDGRFSADWSSDFDRAQPPYTSPDRPEGGWPEQFFLDGVQLTEVPSRDDVTSGTFYHSVSSGQVVLGDDPRGRLVEGSTLPWGLYLNQADGSSVSGLTVQRYATPQRNMAAVRAYADDLTVSDVEVRDNARIGLSFIGDRIDVERVSAVANGHLGIHGHQSNDVRVLDSIIHDNNREYFDAWHSAGGLKVTESERLEIRGNDVRRNDGPGIWTDLDVIDAVIADNVVVDSMRSGIEVELSWDVVVVDNIVARSGEQGVWVLESSRVDVFNNHLSANERAVWVLDGPRADLRDVRIGNNVLAGPARAGVLLAVDDWTEQRNAADMRVTLDGNRYWAPGSTALVRWSNWPASLTYASDLGALRSIGQEASGVVSNAASNPFAIADVENTPVPTRVESQRSGTVVVAAPTIESAPAGAPTPRVPGRTIDDAGWTAPAVLGGAAAPTAERRGEQRTPNRVATASLDDAQTSSAPSPAPVAPALAPSVAGPETRAEIDTAIDAVIDTVIEPELDTEQPTAGGWLGYADQIFELLAG